MKPLNILIVVLGLVLIISGTSSAKHIQWKTEDGGNGHWYERVQDYGIDWYTAKTFAEEAGGYLATITSSDENIWVYDNVGIGEGDDYWLGGTDEESDGDWAWITGEEWSFTNWSPEEPNGEYLENCLHYYNIRYEWNDIHCMWEDNNGYIVEYDSLDEETCNTDIADSDSDGVIDTLDECPETPQGSAVYSNGCSAAAAEGECVSTYDLSSNRIYIPCFEYDDIMYEVWLSDFEAADVNIK